MPGNTTEIKTTRKSVNHFFTVPLSTNYDDNTIMVKIVNFSTRQQHNG